MNSRESGLAPLPNRSGTGPLLVVVRCDSATAVGSAGNYLDQMYPATVVYTASHLTYLPLGDDEDPEIIGDPCLLTVLGTDGADCPAAVVPEANRLYLGVMTGDVELDPDIAGYVRARRRVIAVDVYADSGGGAVTGEGITGRVALWAYAAGSENPTTELEESEIVKTGAGSYSLPALTLTTSLNAIGVLATAAAPVFGSFAEKEKTWATGESFVPPDTLGTYSVLFDFNAGNMCGAYLTGEPLTEYDGARIWLVPFRSGSTGTGFHRSGSLVLAGRYSTWDAADSKIWSGKDGSMGTAVFRSGLWVDGDAPTSSGTVTSVSGGTTGLTFADPTTTPTLGGTLALASGGTGAALADPGADRFLGWDDSAGSSVWFEPDASLAFTGTQVGVNNLDFGTW